MLRIASMTLLCCVFSGCGGDDPPDGGRDDSPTLTCSDPAADANLDQDGDGFSPCQGDCDDADPEAFPGAVEESQTDGWDQDCDNFQPIKV